LGDKYNFGNILRDCRELVPKTDLPHLFTIRVVQHCAAISATALAAVCIL